MTTLEENRRLREMCKKYLAWLNVVDVDADLEKELHNPEMWRTTTNKRKPKRKPRASAERCAKDLTAQGKE